MINLKTIKHKIWKSVLDGDRTAFESACTELGEYAANEWWRLGWGLGPKNIGELSEAVGELAKLADGLWKEAIECGDAPAEDVSPAEGFLRVKEIIDETIEKIGEKKTK